MQTVDSVGNSVMTGSFAHSLIRQMFIMCSLHAKHSVYGAQNEGVGGVEWFMF